MAINPNQEIYSSASDAVRDLVSTLCQVAQASSWLAKKSFGPNKDRAYQIKIKALNTLIQKDCAKPNGISGAGIVGLDLECDPLVRLHVPLSLLAPQARKRVLQQLHPTCNR